MRLQDRGIEGLGEKEEDLNEWDSGILCPHPEPPPKTEEEIEAEKKMKIEQLTWDEWCQTKRFGRRDRAAPIIPWHVQGQRRCAGS